MYSSTSIENIYKSQQAHLEGVDDENYSIHDEDKVIPSGKYFFLQGILSENSDLVENEQEKNLPITHEVREAAMELYLQILWNEKKPADNTIYLRVLHEEHGFVFQLIRKILSDE